MDFREQVEKNLKKGKIEPQKTRKITKDDLFLSEKTEREVSKVVDYLRDPSVFGEELGYSGLIFHGPPGTGKTLSALYIVNQTGANFFAIETIPMRGGEEVIRQLFQAARKSAKEKKRPSIIFIDEIDKYFSKREDVADITDVRTVSQMLSEMDGLYSNERVLVIGSTNRPDAIDPALRRPGRFDKEIEIGPPDEDGRMSILEIHANKKHSFKINENDLSWLAKEAFGYTGGDIKGLMKEALSEAQQSVVRPLKKKYGDKWVSSKEWAAAKKKKLTVEQEHFKCALETTFPSGLRGLYFKKPEKSFADIGGYDIVKSRLEELVIDTIKHADEYKELKIPTGGVILNGPAGTGKTVIAEATAKESGANLLFVRGPEIHHWLYGKSETIIRDVFRKAKNAAPAIIVFDEIDSMVSTRTNYSTPSDSIVGQILSQMSSVEGVCVIGTTNRMDKVDPALLRKGRLGTHIVMPLPDKESLTRIWELYLGHIPAKYDISGIKEKLGDLVLASDNLSGADVEHLVKEYIKIPLVKGKKPVLDELLHGIDVYKRDRGPQQ